MNEAAESQIICAAADQTVLVVEEGITRGSDGSRACELLTQVGASMLGAVLGRPIQKNGHAEPFSTLPVVNRVPPPAPRQSLYLTVPVREKRIEGRGASEESASPRARVNASTEGVDSPPVALAESAVAAALGEHAARRHQRSTGWSRQYPPQQKRGVAAEAPSDEVAVPSVEPDEAARTPENGLLIDAGVGANAALEEEPEAVALRTCLEEQTKNLHPRNLHRKNLLSKDLRRMRRACPQQPRRRQPKVRRARADIVGAAADVIALGAPRVMRSRPSKPSGPYAPRRAYRRAPKIIGAARTTRGRPP